ncbi:MAG TPA: hypothetical protein VGZ22_14010, partial [Isosphaeraceae bacterium]|nr:hypothetical protein [Isosphaeraceae bacterium]
MALALAPRWSRGLLSIVLVGLWPLVASAQSGKAAPDTKKGGSAPAKKDESKAAPKGTTKGADAAPDDGGPSDVDPDAVVDPSQARKQSLIEMYKDPRAVEALDVNKFKALPPVARAPSRKEIQEMAQGGGNLNREVLQSFVNANVATLTAHTNLKALVDPEQPKEGAKESEIKANTSAINGRVKQLQDAAEGLIEPLTLSASSNNQRFRQEYNRLLLVALPKLLDNHLIARTEAMIILSKTADPDALPHFIKQLNDPNQVMMVKLSAAEGITNVAQHGRVKVDVGRANQAAKALSEYLQRESDTFWFAQMRALEALGSLRIATDMQGQNQCEMAGVALKFLADPDANPQLRATAAWALGMMNVPSAARFNYALVAYHMGQAAADIADQVIANTSSNPDLADKLAGLLLYPIREGFYGEEGLKDAGLMNSPNMGPAKSAVTGVASRVQDVAVAAFNRLSPATA